MREWSGCSRDTRLKWGLVCKNTLIKRSLCNFWQFAYIQKGMAVSILPLQNFTNYKDCFMAIFLRPDIGIAR